MRVTPGSIAACRARRDLLFADLGLGVENEAGPRCIGMRLRGRVRAVGPAEASGVVRMVESSDEVGMLPLLWHVQHQASPQVGDLGTRMAMSVAGYASERISALERQRSRSGRAPAQGRSQSYGMGSGSRS